METVTTLMTALAGMTFSLAIGLLMEELIFGRVLCPLLARHVHAARPDPPVRKKAIPQDDTNT